MIRPLPLALGLVAAIAAAAATPRVVPADLVLRPQPGEEYRLAPWGRATAVPVVRRLEALPCVVPFAPPCAPGWREEAMAGGDLLEVEPGTAAGLLRVEGDAFQHPALRVRILDGRHAGQRAFASRWHLRRYDGPGPFGLGVIVAVVLAAGLGAGAVADALLTLARSRTARPPD